MSFDSLIKGMIGSNFSQSVTRSENSVTVNGKTIKVSNGASVSVVNGDVYINGKLQEKETNVVYINLTIDGNCEDVSSDGNVTVQGTCGGIKASGNVNCANVVGSVSAGGNVRCATVRGNLSAGGNVSRL